MRIFASSYLFPHSFSWAVQARSRQDKDNGDLVGYQVEWLLKGFVSGSGKTGAGSMSSALQTLINAAEGDDKSFYVRDGSTTSATVVTRGELSAANTEGGTRATVKVGGNPSQQYQTGVDVEVSISGFIPETTAAGSVAGIISHEYTGRYAKDAHDITTYTVSGKLRATDATSALALASANAPGTPSGYVRHTKDFNVDSDDREVSYTLVFRQFFKSPPSIDPRASASRQSTHDAFSITHAITATVTGRKGNSIKTVRKRALKLARELTPSGASRRGRRIQENEFTNTVSVADEVVEARAGGVIEYNETVSVSVDYGNRHRPIRNGRGGDWHTVKSQPTAVTVRQSGSMTALSPPIPPEPLYPVQLDRKEITPASPRLSHEGKPVEYQTSWAYEMFLGTDETDVDHPELSL